MRGRQVDKFRIFYILFSIPFYPLFSAPGNQHADFLIIENPMALEIRNKYEQNITTAESDLFLPFCPLRIEKSNLMLSDNFTLADQVRWNNQTFYLLKKDRQNLLQIRKTGYLKRISRGIVLEDTVVIEKVRSVYLQTPGSNEKTLLEPGTLLNRIFSDDTQIYVQVLDESQRFGWCNLSDPSTWEPLIKKTADLEWTAILSRIQPVFIRYNELYRQWIQFFNDRTGANRQAPVWQIELKSGRISAFLSNSPGSTFPKESFPYLVSELQQVLLSTGRRLSMTDDQIEIM